MIIKSTDCLNALYLITINLLPIAINNLLYIDNTHYFFKINDTSSTIFQKKLLQCITRC